MNKVYETYVSDFLADVYEFGAARVSWASMYRWYSAERITKRVWSDLDTRWNDLLSERGDEGWRLGYVHNERGDFLTLVCLDAEGSKEPLLRPVTEKAQ